MRLSTFVEATKKTILVLLEPKKAFQELEKLTLESTVSFYIHMLLLVAIIAGLANFLFFLLRALYLDLFVTVDIQYMRMINYSLSTSSSIILLYLFAGTFILFFISVLIKPFIRKVKYTELLKILMYSMAPLLLFGWLFIPIPFIVWSLFLLFVGLKTYKTTFIRKDSVHNRV